jgi:hypothetical protein
MASIQSAVPFGNWLRRILGVWEGFAPELLPDTLPVAPIINPEGLDLRWWRGWRTYLGSASSPAVAGQQAWLALANPPGSGIIAVIDGVLTSSLSAFGLNGAPPLGALPGIAAVGAHTAFLDARTAPSQPAVCQLRTGSSIGLFGVLAEVMQNSGVPPAYQTNFPMSAVIVPGSYFLIQNLSVAIQETGNFIWRERVADPMELQ